ncbi:hypothetical protein DPMN_053292 [Dreissena polymorpha]|uniref:Uncharacterized protein n=1 Tax=Dreissena polymorpha TaxID=45954 RepID=A0A9D4CN18_DREPO|nr:hypothetical protein DPMN_053292 [Dreissena polymorpha]
MNNIGYGQEIIKARRDAYSNFDRFTNALKPPGTVEQLTSGSKGEGLTFLHESDVDFMIVVESMLCLEDGITYSTYPHGTTVYRLNTSMCYPGHFRLLRESQGTILSSGKFLSHGKFINFVRVNFRQGRVYCGRAGPSLPSSVGAQQMDQVYAHAVPLSKHNAEMGCKVTTLAITGNCSESPVNEGSGNSCWIQTK